MTATRFARWRTSAGLTQQEVADAIGVTKGAVSHWETGRQRLDGMALTLLRMVAAERGWPVP